MYPITSQVVTCMLLLSMKCNPNESRALLTPVTLTPHSQFPVGCPIQFMLYWKFIDYF